MCCQELIRIRTSIRIVLSLLFAQYVWSFICIRSDYSLIRAHNNFKNITYNRYTLPSGMIIRKFHQAVKFLLGLFWRGLPTLSFLEFWACNFPPMTSVLTSRALSAWVMRPKAQHCFRVSARYLYKVRWRLKFMAILYEEMVESGVIDPTQPFCVAYLLSVVAVRVGSILHSLYYWHW